MPNPQAALEHNSCVRVVTTAAQASSTSAPRAIKPDFNPFAALGLQPQKQGQYYTYRTITRAVHQASRHRHQDVLSRLPEATQMAVATLFPTQIHINVAADWFRDGGEGSGFGWAHQDISSIEWMARHEDCFFPAHAPFIGDVLNPKSFQRDSFAAAFPPRGWCRTWSLTYPKVQRPPRSPLNPPAAPMPSLQSRCPQNPTVPPINDMGSRHSPWPQRPQPFLPANSRGSPSQPIICDDDSDNSTISLNTVVNTSGRVTKPPRNHLPPSNPVQIATTINPCRATRSPQAKRKRSNSPLPPRSPQPCVRPAKTILVGSWKSAADPLNPNAIVAYEHDDGTLRYQATKKTIYGTAVAGPAPKALVQFGNINFIDPYASANVRNLECRIRENLRRLHS